MAARKKLAAVEQSSLFMVPPAPERKPAPTYEAPAPRAAEPAALTVVPPRAELPESEVIVEAISGGRFVVSLLRHHGTTVAAVPYTREQLKQLIARAQAALEVG